MNNVRNAWEIIGSTMNPAITAKWTIMTLPVDYDDRQFGEGDTVRRAVVPL